MLQWGKVLVTWFLMDVQEEYFRKINRNIQTKKSREEA